MHSALSAVCIFLILCRSSLTFDSTYTVIETQAQEKMEYFVTSPNQSIKLKCHEIAKAGSRVDDIVWEYKRCGMGLSLPPCEELIANTPWEYAHCRNHTKLCTGVTLPIPDPQESDSGLYRCLHKNYMSSTFQTNRIIRLDVTDPVKHTFEILPENEQLDNQVVFDNQTVVFRCRVKSVRMPYVGWVRRMDDTSIADFQANDSFSMYQFKNSTTTHVGANKLYTSKLYLRNVQLNDSGSYLCLVIDEKRQEAKTVSLTVLPSSPSDRDVESSTEIMWIALALVLSATCCTLVLYLLMRRRRPKNIPVPLRDFIDDAASSSSLHEPVCI